MLPFFIPKLLRVYQTMRTTLLKALLSHAQGHLEKHKANVEIYLENSVGIGEHPQHIDEIDKLFQKIADAQEKLEAIKDYRGERSAL